MQFRFEDDFLENPLPLSPIRLPVTAGTFVPSTSIFEGLYGVFADSLSDGWGRLLQDRAYAKAKVEPDQITLLLRLASVGEQGMGSLTYHPVRASEAPDEWMEQTKDAVNQFSDLARPYDLAAATRQRIERTLQNQLTS